MTYYDIATNLRKNYLKSKVVALIGTHHLLDAFFMILIYSVIF